VDEEFFWQPHEGAQNEFCSRGEFEVLFGGAAGPGKSECLIMEATRYIDHPRYRALLLRRTFPQLQEIIDRCYRYYPKIDGVYRSTEHRWYFPSGATIQLGHMQHEPDKYNYQGREYHFVGFDEVTQFFESQYLYLFSRVRTTFPEIIPRIRATTNPGGIGHSWCKKRFIDMGPPGQTYIDPGTGLSRVFIPAKYTDNPSLTEADPDYVNRLMALPEIERLRLLEGIWDAFEGQAFPELSQRVYGCDPFEIPPEWEKWSAFDWGYSNPWANLYFAVDYDENIFIYRELYGAKEVDGIWRGARQSNTEISRIIVHAEREKIRFRVADPACWGPTKLQGRNDMLGPSFVEDAAKEGLFFVKADNDRIRGKAQIHQRLRLEDEVDEATGEVVKSSPKLIIFNNLTHWWRTMMTIQEDVRNPEDIDTRSEDHLYDVTRYGLMARPLIPKRQNMIPPGSFASERNRYLRAKKYAARHGISIAAAYNRIR
jgi:hypothetical protein